MEPLAVKCPRCKAEPGMWCRAFYGKGSQTANELHLKRKKKASRERQNLSTPPSGDVAGSGNHNRAAD